MPWPDFIIIGAAKAGTTSLWAYLAQHPQVFMTSIKEPRFFAVQNRPRGVQSDPAKQRLWEGTVADKAEYLRLFEGAASHHKALGEASPLYLAWSEQSAAAMQQYVPQAKLIACLRQPVDRAFSHYLHNLRLGLEKCPTFEEALIAEEQAPHTGYLRQGRYSERLKPFYARFPREQIRVYLQEDLAADSGAVFRDICLFLGIDPDVAVRTTQRHNVSQAAPRSAWLQSLIDKATFRDTGEAPRRPSPTARLWDAPWRALDRLNHPRQPRLQPVTRRRLTESFREDIVQLEQLIGRDLSRWLEGRSSRSAGTP